jgi:hypothetical protein
MSFRLNEELSDKIDELSKILEIYAYGFATTEYKLGRSSAICLALEDTFLRFFGEKNNPDDIVTKDYEKKSQLTAILKVVQIKKKLGKLPEKERKDLEKIITKYYVAG